MQDEVSRMVSVDVLRLPSTVPKLGLLSDRCTVSSPSQDDPVLMIGIVKVATIWPGREAQRARGRRRHAHACRSRLRRWRVPSLVANCTVALPVVSPMRWTLMVTLPAVSSTW